MTFGKLLDFSVPSCSYFLSEITSTGLTALTRFHKSQMRWANKLFDNLDFPSQCERDFLLSRLKCTVQRERQKVGSECGAEGETC